jgi:hypothetical protein
LNLDPKAQGFQLCPLNGSRRSSQEITLYNVWFVWIDKGDLHGKLETILDSGNRIPDEAFEALEIGQEYDINIWFNMPGMSVWRYADYDTIHLDGWPSKNQLGWYGLVRRSNKS